MKRDMWLCLSFLVLLPSALHADYLEVRRPATIKERPEGQAAIIQRVQPGTYLILLEGDQTNGYYQVQRPSTDQPGWIFRTLVRRHSGEPPEPDASDVNPLDDPTGVLTSAQRRHAERHLRLGKPQAVYERVREGYVLGQDARLKIPLWVQYELSRQELDGPAERSDDFRADTSIPPGSRAELGDYAGSGFDRGHMAPAADMNRSTDVMSESFLLSNMAPQVGIGFNRHIWAQLEDAVRGWVRQRGPLTIIIGPIFEVEDNKVTYRVIGDSHVAVATHFYKIVVDTNNPESPDALAFILPNESLTGRNFPEFLATIDEVEAATGLDFLSRLEDERERSLESRRAQSVW